MGTSAAGELEWRAQRAGGLSVGGWSLGTAMRWGWGAGHWRWPPVVRHRHRHSGERRRKWSASRSKSNTSTGASHCEASGWGGRVARGGWRDACAEWRVGNGGGQLHAHFPVQKEEGRRRRARTEKPRIPRKHVKVMLCNAQAFQTAVFIRTVTLI